MFSYDRGRLKKEILFRIAQTIGALSRQEHCPQLQNQTFLGYFNLPACVWIMEPYSRVIEKDTNYRNEMLSKTFEHLL